ncbi:SGNH/GDSL hydrolase family protein [Neorhodopirellula pilleata]|uniref:GDSL-like Lipase/Acylhydrolase n=1 Tax=Neorhodopirellula pilleata TaxID=2714738 RepID=A0A5C6AFH8_9BACT|nr:SGNH/GDSL hydrolase family protein [Neorhodopirellula pilleata]TWT98724.1 GDSL-like Lipase/Acylhydrolase [Neorhodopirellula pilleata]
MIRRFGCCGLMWLAVVVTGGTVTGQSVGIDPVSTASDLAPIPTFGPFLYESKPDGVAFEKLNPRKCPPMPEQSLLRKGDRLAIIGDSITEQKMYSRIIETYLTVCLPQLEIQTRQLGWSGETAERFLKRMDQDCLRFDPTIATLCYGMNDAKYRPFDFNNSVWFASHYGAIAERLQQSGARVILGSPGCAGKIAKWTKTKAGTLDEHNQHLCALRDLTIEIAGEKRVGFADVFWPMYMAQVEGDARYSTPENPYEVAGSDGIHPGWSGHTIMAYAFLIAMGLDGDLAKFEIDLARNKLSASDGHQLESQSDRQWTLTSSRYPFCASGPVDDDGNIRSGMSMVPFNERLNRWTLRVTGLDAPMAMVHWGDFSQRFPREELAVGVNLAEKFDVNPFSEAFGRVDQAVAAKQAYETEQIKKRFHSKEGQADIEKTVRETEAERMLLVQAIEAARQPVSHTILIEPILP